MTPATPPSRAAAVTGRVLAQLRGDRRFVAVSTVVPVIVIFLLKMFWDALGTPLLDQSEFAVPGGAYIVHFVTFVLTAIVLVRERVLGTMERMFTDGYRPGEIVAGYLGGYTLLATLQSILILAELNWLFDLGFGLGRFGEVFLVMWLLSVLSMALGMLVSNAARNEGQVFPFIPLVMLPTVFLSGMVVAVDKLPGWAQALARGIPLRYAVDVVREILAGGTLLDAIGALLMLPAMIVVALVLASRTLREEL
jgi:ABC-2 type transport system permease protein